MSRIRANQITNQSADGAPTVQNGLIISGVTTVTTLDLNGDLDVDGHLNADNVSIAGVITATSFVGSGANLTSLPVQVTINNASGNRVITSDGGTTLNGEANFSYDGTRCLIGTNTAAPYVNRNLTVAQGSSGNTTVAIEVRSPTNGDGRIIFTDSTSAGAGAYKGQIRYDQTNDFMSFNTNGDNERLRITSDGDVAIGRDTALNNYAAGSTTTQLAVVKDGGAAGSGYHEVAHFTGGNDSDDTGAIVRITQFNNDRGLYIKGGRGTGDQAKAIFGLRNSSNSDSDVMVFHQGGNVTKPSEVGFHATGTSTYTHSSNFVPEFNTEYFDIGGGYNNSNYRFTAPVAGRYFFYYQYLTYPDADPAYKTFLLRKNGSSTAYDHGFYRGREGTHGNQASQQMSTYIQLAENDYIEPWIELGSQGSNYKNYMGSGHAHFWGYLVH